MVDVEPYFSLVYSISKKVIKKLPLQVELDDVVSAGMVGLVDASKKFDESKGNKFNTYATYRIWGSIVDELRKQDLCSRTVRKKQKAGGNISYLFEQAHSGPCLFTAMYKMEVRQILVTAMNCLPEKCRIVMYLRYYKGLDFDEINKIFGKSKAWASKVHKDAIDKLRQMGSVRDLQEEKTTIH